jgi:hypothetical protein
MEKTLARSHCVQRSHSWKPLCSEYSDSPLGSATLQAESMRALDDGSNLLFSAPSFVERHAFIDVLPPALEAAVKAAR